MGPARTELNPAFFKTCDRIVPRAAARGLYMMMYSMWAGKTAGTMNNYTPEQLENMGRALGSRYAGVSNVIFCAGRGSPRPHSHRCPAGERHGTGR